MKRWFVTAALFLVGCAQPGSAPLYQWEGYQPALYEYLKASHGGPTGTIAQLEAQLQKNAVNGQASPPGLRAHLGLLYARSGDDAAARRALEAEKQAFPEAARFMDFLLGAALSSAAAPSATYPANPVHTEHTR